MSGRCELLWSCWNLRILEVYLRIHDFEDTGVWTYKDYCKPKIWYGKMRGGKACLILAKSVKRNIANKVLGLQEGFWQLDKKEISNL